MLIRTSALLSQLLYAVAYNWISQYLVFLYLQSFLFEVLTLSGREIFTAAPGWSMLVVLRPPTNIMVCLKHFQISWTTCIVLQTMSFFSRRSTFYKYLGRFSLLPAELVTNVWCRGGTTAGLEELEPHKPLRKATLHLPKVSTHCRYGLSYSLRHADLPRKTWVWFPASCRRSLPTSSYSYPLRQKLFLKRYLSLAQDVLDGGLISIKLVLSFSVAFFFTYTLSSRF